MKKVLIILVATLVSVALFSGCATNGVYNVGKTIYVGGKAVVVMNADLLDEKTLNTLKKADDYATRYDDARGVVKKSLEADAVIAPTSISTK